MSNLTSDSTNSSQPAAIDAARMSLKQGDRKGGVRSRLREGSAQREAVVAVETPSVWDRVRSWHRATWKWATGPEGLSVVVSAGVHAVLFAGLLLVLYLLGLRLDNHPGDQGPINAIFTEKNVEKTAEIETPAAMASEPDDALASDLLAMSSRAVNDNPRIMPETALSEFADSTAMLPALPENSLDLVNEGGGEGKSWKRGGFAMPRNKGKVVTQGSFSVWTVPEDPEPFKSYKIVIQLNRRVPIRDLRQDVTGTVTGTDGYRASIGRVERGYHYPRQLAIPKAHQIAIEIPPAKFELVRDVIEVHSQTLDESQRIEIVF